MEDIRSKIKDIDKVICNNISKFRSDERGLLSQNILSQLRNFVETIALGEYVGNTSIDKLDYENIKKGIEYIKTKKGLRFLYEFHTMLQKSVSHYTPNEDSSERLMLKYYGHLLNVKLYLENKYIGEEFLYNIEDFPIKQDIESEKYYKTIADKIEEQKNNLGNTHKDRFYIKKKRPFFVNKNIYYEITFTIANDKTSKFDRLIAFTKEDIPDNYAVKLSIIKDYINFLNTEMPIQIIVEWEVSIRKCEIKNFAKIFGLTINTNRNWLYELMLLLKNTGQNLLDIILLGDPDYSNFKKEIKDKEGHEDFFNLLDQCRQLIIHNKGGCNIIRYLLFKLNNKIIKGQLSKDTCQKLSGLYLKYDCIPFDQMPYNTSLKGHNPPIEDLLMSINTEGREHEFLARQIKNNTEYKGELYTSTKDFNISSEYIDHLVETWNNKLYKKHTGRRIERFNNYLYISEYETSIIEIINKIKDLSNGGVQEYKNSVEQWLTSSSYNIDSEEKKNAIKELFEKSRVALIYGSAGTGKSTMINHISSFFSSKSKLYLANTNPAVDNLKRKVLTDNSSFKTIENFKNSSDSTCDILIIDECSTISNSDMISVLRKAEFKLLILVGDTYQIESISYGTWFKYMKLFIPKSSVFELKDPFRSANNNLLDIWDRVRKRDNSILEIITKNNVSKRLDQILSDQPHDDEIILCLNYDGLYGINNINLFLQSNNKNTPIIWGTNTYKVNDPIIFNESKRFHPLIYNNLKGKILNIKTFEKEIEFEIEVCTAINGLDAENYDFTLVGSSETGNSIIRFKVGEYTSTDEEDDDDFQNVIPFQVSYAVSIHKSQGLEYDSVKIIIAEEVGELISHNIFYTAITRAREHLQIYWSPETENKVLEGFEDKFNAKDYSILKDKIKKLGIP